MRSRYRIVEETTLIYDRIILLSRVAYPVKHNFKFQALGHDASQLEPASP